MGSGVTRIFDQALKEVLRVVAPTPGGRLMGLSMLLTKGRTLFVADTNLTELPDGKDLMEIAVEAANAVRRMGHTPRVAFLSYSSLGNHQGDRGEQIREAVERLDARDDIDFESDGEMPPALALVPSSRVF